MLLWPDTWNNYYHPQSLIAAAQILERAGFTPEVPRQHVCCGRPLYDFGFLQQARAYLEKILADFAPQIDAGLPFIFLEPSCASVFRDELVNFFPPIRKTGPARSASAIKPSSSASSSPATRPISSYRISPAKKSSSTATAITNR